MAAPFNENSVLRGVIRRAFARSPLVREILEESKRYVPRYKKDGTRHKVDRVERQCQVCGEWVSASMIEVDHKIPVISVNEGFVDWNTFIDRVWHCGKENLQRICDPCHDVKTALERFERTLRQELKFVIEIEKDPCPVPLREAHRFLKKFTNKRLDKYPVPFQLDILKLKTRYGIKFKRKVL